MMSMTVNESMEKFGLHPCNVLSTMTSRRPITIDEAVDLKLLLFGNLKDSFSDAWTEQSFYFRTAPPYGFLQNRAGPCGVLAAVQSYVIYELFFGVSSIPENFDLKKLRSSHKKEVLSRAIAKILWKAGGNQSAIICVRHSNIVLNADEAPAVLERDGMIEYLHIHFFECMDCLMEYLINCLSEMTTDDKGGCILFLYSVLLTRGIENIKEEMDDPKSHFIGTDGYCSQEIINLILIGKAVTNLFDGEVELNSGGSETTIHHGIPKQSEIGLLSLYDYQGTSPVGIFYKEPVYPIWLLLGESHFTTLFAKTSVNNSNSLTLYHYDGLAKTHAETIYLIKPLEKNSAPEKDNTLSVAVRCIYTKWPLASIETIEKNSN